MIYWKTINSSHLVQIEAIILTQQQCNSSLVSAAIMGLHQCTMQKEAFLTWIACQGKPLSENCIFNTGIKIYSIVSTRFPEIKTP